MNKLLMAILLLFSSVVFSAEGQQANCGIIPGQPIVSPDKFGTGLSGDYTNPQHYQPGNQVERAHFTQENENTLSRNSTANITYTLIRFPNHHRALYAMMRNLEAGHGEKSRYSMECWFKRAAYLAPNDAMVYMLSGIYHQRNSELEKSKEQYLKALRLKPNDPQINYNLGLLYFKMDDYESASKRAEVAYSNGHPLEGLRKKLSEVGFTVTVRE